MAVGGGGGRGDAGGVVDGSGGREGGERGEGRGDGDHDSRLLRRYTSWFSSLCCRKTPHVVLTHSLP